MSRIAFISDLHADASTGGVKRFGDVCQFVDSVIQTPDIDMVFFCGDLADPDSVDVHACVAACGRWGDALTRRGVRFELIPGNHDVVEDGRGTTILDALPPDNVHKQPAVIERFGLNFGILPYTARAWPYDPTVVLESWAKVGAKIDVFVGHLNIGGHGPGSETTDMPRGREVFWPTNEIARHYPNAACIGGHYHKEECIGFRDQRVPGTTSTQCIYIVGAPERFTFGEESNDPGYLILDTATMTIAPIPNLNARQVITLDKLDPTGVRAGAIVRLKVNASHSDIEEFAMELTKQRLCTVVRGQGDIPVSAPTEMIARVGDVFEDPVEAARKLAAEWPAIDQAAEEFRQALVGVVEDIAEEES